jgi:hypothetical protein
MKFPFRGLLFVSILAGSAVLAGAQAKAPSGSAVRNPPAKPDFEACDVPNVPGGGRCATYEVYENRAAGKGRKIGLHLLVLPALSKTPAPDPVFWLHGGPGAAASDTASTAKGGFLEGLRAEHDLVFVDQRGTGRSHPLSCDVGDDSTDLAGYFGKLLPPELVRACRQLLEKDADLALYTTSIAMDDLDDVRAALGYETIDIVAASYGSIAAQAYIRQHGDRVRWRPPGSSSRCRSRAARRRRWISCTGTATPMPPAGRRFRSSSRSSTPSSPGSTAALSTSG